ncbi:MAG: class II fructose-bisphosphate aldolase [Bacillota bacterium]
MEMLRTARKGGYAVPAFAAIDLQSIKAIVKVCEDENAPCLLESHEYTVRAQGEHYLVAIAETAARTARVPVALHLDHGKSFDLIVRCLRAGFSSVMIDASEHDFEKNVALTRRVVEVAHAMGVGVEAELGKVGQASVEPTEEERRAALTDPAEAAQFVELTGVDALAVSVGTAHGAYKYEPRLELGLLAEIARRVSIPLVLHGGSGTPGLERTPPLGIAKVNIFTDLQVPIRNKVREIMETQDLERLFAATIWGQANAAAEPVIRDRIRTLGAAGKA